MNLRSILTGSQYEILERFALGESQKEIACNTHRSFFTVQTTIKAIYEKLGINKATEAVLIYCSQTFDIAEQVRKKQIEVLKHNVKEFTAIALLFISLFDCVAAPQQTLYRRSLRSRRKQETEVVILKCNIGT